MQKTRPDPAVARDIVARLKAAGHEAYLVGGCVRDLLRQVEPEDYDIATSAKPAEIQALFPRTVPVGISFGVLLVVEGGNHYEVATFRADDVYTDGRHPSAVRFATAREDVLRRDFTINGLLLDPTSGEIIDYVGGRDDLQRGIIRTIGTPESRFAEDHLRLLRAIRFAVSLDFAIEPATWAAIRRQADRIALISAERIREELTKILTQGGARRGFELLEETGLLQFILPEAAAMRGVAQPPLYHPEGDVWEHTMRMLALLPETAASEGVVDEALAWGALFHDIGKAYCRTEDERGIHFYGHVTKGREIAETVMKRLRFSGETIERVLSLIRYHMFFMNVQRMRTSRLKRFLRMPDFPLHLALHWLDCKGSHGRLENYHFCEEKLREFGEQDLFPPPLLKGRDLIELGYKPGPLFTTILKTVENAQLANLISSAEEARQLVLSRFIRP